jgi:hypothetical protein
MRAAMFLDRLSGDIWSPECVWLEVGLTIEPFHPARAADMRRAGVYR